jgi:3-(3-hydroxy-phenyl)propionate hydroxylase
MRAQLADPDAITVEPPHPRLGEPSITLPSGGAEGRLSVQGRVETARHTGLFDDVIGGAWQLIGLGVDPAALLADADLAWFTGIGGTVTDVGGNGPVRDVDGTYRSWFESHECTVLLARPDFYVFATGEPGDVPTMLSGLRRALGTIHSERKVVVTA